MKNVLVSMAMLAMFPFSIPDGEKVPIDPQLVTRNVFIITIDGFRWQEFYSGADSLLINNPAYTADTETIRSLFWSSSPGNRRKKLLPFCWTVIASKGQLHGNRDLHNKMNVANLYAKSYPGYSEIFTGTTDPDISSNERIDNPNLNVLEWINGRKGFHGRVAAFTSWDVFPFILNCKRNNLHVNCGHGSKTNNTRNDQLTFMAAKDYLEKEKPRILFLGFGETDEFAHEGRYDLYLQQANKIDQMIAELWNWAQTTPGYKNNTTFIITTDHGRGSKPGKWMSHGQFIKGSSQTWMAILGPQIPALGEIKQKRQLYQQQIAQTIAHLSGNEFEGEGVAAAIQLRGK